MKTINIKNMLKMTIMFIVFTIYVTGCIYAPNIEIDKQTLSKIVETKQFFEQNDVDIQKLKKCLQLSEQIKLDENTQIKVENGIIQILEVKQ